MKKLFVILLIVALLPATVQTANNQKVIFSGEFSLNNEGTDADSAYLYIYRYDEVRDSALVTAEDLSLLDGCYSHQITVEQDSGSGWYGFWLFVETANDVRVTDEATITLAPDTASLKADTTGIAADVYAEFTDGNNEDAFKATGFSTFDPTIDSVLVTMAVLFARMAADSVAVNLLPGVIDSTVYDTASMRYFFELFFTSALTLAQQLDTAHIGIKAIRDTAQYLVTGSGDTTGLAESVYAEFIDGSNENNFKANVTALALETTVAALNDFDPATEKVTLVDSSADGIHDAEIAALDGLDSANVIHQKLFFQGLSDSSTAGSSPWSEAEVDSVLNALADANKENFHSDGDTNKIQGATVAMITAVRDSMDEAAQIADTAGIAQDVYAEFIDGSNENEFKATGFSTHGAAAIWDLTTDGHTGAGSFGLMLESCSTSVFAIRDTTQYLITSDGDTNTNPFDNANDKVTLVDTSAGGIHDAEIAALDGIDSANVIHQKLFFQGLSDSSAGGGSSWTEAEVDSMLNAIADVNKPNFQSEGDTNKIQGAEYAQVDSLKDTVEDMSSRLLATGFATHSQVDSLKDTVEDMSTRLLATGFSTLTDTELRDAIGDSLYNERMNSLLTLLVEVKGYSLDLAYYWGACDGCYYRLYPEGGLANKDSAIIIDPSQGPDSLVGKVVYLHGTDVEIVDTVYFYRDDPW